jgi:hypothetical protein
MVKLEETAEVLGERFGQARVAVGNMADEIDQILQSDHAAVVCGGWRLQEELAQTGILVKLRLEVLLVRERVVADFVLQVGQIGIDLLQRSDLSLHGCNTKKRWYVNVFVTGRQIGLALKTCRQTRGSDETFSDLI